MKLCRSKKKTKHQQNSKSSMHDVMPSSGQICLLLQYFSLLVALKVTVSFNVSSYSSHPKLEAGMCLTPLTETVCQKVKPVVDNGIILLNSPGHLVRLNCKYWSAPNVSLPSGLHGPFSRRGHRCMCFTTNTTGLCFITSVCIVTVLVLLHTCSGRANLNGIRLNCLTVKPAS